MKTKDTILSLRKQTIAALNQKEQNIIKGGVEIRDTNNCSYFNTHTCMATSCKCN